MNCELRISCDRSTSLSHSGHDNLGIIVREKTDFRGDTSAASFDLAAELCRSRSRRFSGTNSGKASDFPLTVLSNCAELCQDGTQARRPRFCFTFKKSVENVADFAKSVLEKRCQVCLESEKRCPGCCLLQAVMVRVEELDMDKGWCTGRDALSKSQLRMISCVFTRLVYRAHVVMSIAVEVELAFE